MAGPNGTGRLLPIPPPPSDAPPAAPSTDSPPPTTLMGGDDTDVAPDTPTPETYSDEDNITVETETTTESDVTPPSDSPPGECTFSRIPQRCLGNREVPDQTPCVGPTCAHCPDGTPRGRSHWTLSG